MRTRGLIPMLVVVVLLFTRAASAYVTSVKVEDRGTYVMVRYYNVSPSGTRATIESAEAIRKADVIMVTLSSHEDRLQSITIRIFLRGLEGTERATRDYYFMVGGEEDARSFLDDLTKAVFK